MSDDLRSLIEKRNAFYEVSPYYVFVEQNHGSVTAKVSRRIQAGFDIDIYGVNSHNDPDVPAGSPDYVLGYVELKKIAKNLALHAMRSCFIDVIPFPERVVIDSRNRAKEAMLRIRIAHTGELDEPAGAPEQNALQEFETELQRLGLARR
jgi:hypothetical protein